MNNVPDNLRFGGGISSSTMHPAVLCMMILALALTFVLPKRQVIVPLLVAVFFIPFGQLIYVAGYTSCEPLPDSGGLDPHPPRAVWLAASRESTESCSHGRCCAPQPHFSPSWNSKRS